MMQQAHRHDFVTLDGLRGIAAFAVVTRHASVFFSPFVTHGSIPNSAGEFPVAGPLFESYLAVDFFFVLSGFVLAHAYGEKLRKGMSAGRFMAIRLVRLYPLYFLALALALITNARAAVHGEVSFSEIAINAAFAVFFLPSPLSSDLFPLNGPAWSLFFELIANAIFSLLGRRLTQRLLILIVGAAGSILAVAVTMRWFGFGELGMGAMPEGFYWQSIGGGFLRVTFSFFAGILTYRLWIIWRPMRQLSSTTLMIILVAVLSARPPVVLERAYDLLAVLIVFPLIVMLGASAKSNVRLARIFSAIGLASYGVYVLQFSFYIALMRLLYKLPGFSIDRLSIVSGLAFVVILYFLVNVIDSIYDIPIRRWLMRVFIVIDRP